MAQEAINQHHLLYGLPIWKVLPFLQPIKKSLPRWVHDPKRCHEIWMLEDECIDEDWIDEFFGKEQESDEEEE